MSIHGHSAACCTIPPVNPTDYSLKGKYEEIGGLNTYVVGTTSATKAILVIYDIFGYFPQTIQGADILAYSDKEHAYQVFMPDFFDGEPADIAWYPPVTEDQSKALYSWFTEKGTPSTAAVRVPAIIRAIETAYGPKTWGGVGFCWGGKIISIISGPSTLFRATCQAHPGMIDAADAAEIVVPTCMLASGEENAEEVREWEEALKVEKYVERFPGQVHGWMAARGDLEDAEVQAEYERGFKIFLDFFAQHL